MAWGAWNLISTQLMTLRDDEELEALQPSSPPLDDARERIGLKKRVAVCVDNRGVMRAASMA